MSQPDEIEKKGKKSASERVSGLIERHALVVVTTTVLMTAVLALPFILMPPTSSASQEPPGEVFEARDLVAERFASPTHRMVFVFEAQDGNILDRSSLLELRENEESLQTDSSISTKLTTYFDRSAGREVKGLLTIADAVEVALRARGVDGLSKATEAQVGETVALILSKAGPTAFALSTKTRRDESTGRWISPALMTYVLADNEALGGGGGGPMLGSDDTTKEEFAREVLRLLRGDQEQNRAWGLAIDVNLTSLEQGRSAGPFIGLTLFAVLILLGLTFRSYWAMAVTGFGLGTLIIWLEGAANLIGLKSDQILSIIVPIAMISFGVDFAFHAIGRYREEFAEGGRSPRSAFVVGLGSVMGALLVAMASDSAAFLANTTSGIESLVQFGIAASVATVSAFFVLGVVTPLLLSLFEDRFGLRPQTRGGVVVSMAGGLASSLWAMATVVVSVFVLPWAGVLLLAGHGLFFLLLPALLCRRFCPKRESEATRGTEATAGAGSPLLGRIVAGTARFRAVLLPVMAIITGFAAWGAHKVQANFDVRDFFASTTDFVVGLDRFDEHVGEQSGEPADVFIEAELTDPRVVATLSRFREKARSLETERLARDGQDRVKVKGGVLDLIDLVLETPAALKALTAETGTTVSDENGDGIPDNARQLEVVYRFTSASGVPRDEQGALALTPEVVKTMIWRDESTRLTFRIPGSRVQEQIEEARLLLEPMVEELEVDLRRHDPDARAVLTGGPIVRQASLDAILLAFRLSIPVAVLLCLIVATVFMRSLRYAVVSTIPVLLVAAWLYGFMYAMGYAINVVTATIGAISIGVGIDFSVHFTMRFREELARTATRFDALTAAGSGTGLALAASAFSSALGFAILSFAPMPMFASYGLLTALMIVFALLSALIVLPSLLMLVTPKPR